MKVQAKDLGGIIYSSYTEVNRYGEQFMREHMIGFLISGTLTIIDGDKTHTLKEGDIMLYRKNNLAKFIKQPVAGKEFVAITVILDEKTLADFNKGQQLTAGEYPSQQAVLSIIEPDNLLQHYFDSLMPYFNESASVADNLVQLKKHEIILLLLRYNPALKDILFDFGVPGKIDLEAFMHRNFRYNVPMEKLAYLTGRSLATFKRDFEKTFNTSPSRWIQQQRLKEAHYLISKKKIKPSDVYLEVGFESLSHFSYSFKQFFGKNPSAI